MYNLHINYLMLIWEKFIHYYHFYTNLVFYYIPREKTKMNLEQDWTPSLPYQWSF